MTGPIAIEDVRRLDVRPGDSLLFTVPRAMEPQELDRLAEALRLAFGEGIKHLVVTPDVDVSVIRAEP